MSSGKQSYTIISVYVTQVFRKIKSVNQNLISFTAKIHFENPGFLSENSFITGGYFETVRERITVKIHFENPGFLSENSFITGGRRKTRVFMSGYFETVRERIL
ncbi:Uncharacterized protein dnm_051930 [Desulfonema magnum]|uniref:Uncharacterized protein n=1 Tax=Desulfonema magnum TaxID=45655 RepID=A0A975GPS7_9BACT|nr:Uncharacterized protein dnm_051930 [Desulfonema magnum]